MGHFFYRFFNFYKEKQKTKRQNKNKNKKKTLLKGPLIVSGNGHCTASQDSYKTAN